MAASAPGTPLAPFTLSRRNEIGCPTCKHRRLPGFRTIRRRAAHRTTPGSPGSAALEGRPEPTTADLIVHPLLLSRATALPDGSGGSKSRFQATAWSVRRTGDVHAHGPSDADERTMLRGATVDADV